MPLLNGTCWYPSTHKPSDTSTHESKVFRVRQTGEIFQSYEEYIGRLRLLHSKRWTSQCSGRNGLNYEQALEEDDNVDDLIAKVVYHDDS